MGHCFSEVLFLTLFWGRRAYQNSRTSLISLSHGVEHTANMGRKERLKAALRSAEKNTSDTSVSGEIKVHQL